MVKRVEAWIFARAGLRIESREDHILSMLQRTFICIAMIKVLCSIDEYELPKEDRIGKLRRTHTKEGRNAKEEEVTPTVIPRFRRIHHDIYNWPLQSSQSALAESILDYPYTNKVKL